MSKRLFAPLLLTGVVALVYWGLSFTGGQVSAQQPQPAATVTTQGECGMSQNERVFCDVNFQPGTVEVMHGAEVMFSDEDDVQFPHTITIVQENALPTSFQEIFTCQPCHRALRAHFHGRMMGPGMPPHDGDGGGGPGKPPNDGDNGDKRRQPKPVVNVGAQGLDMPGDSLLLKDGQSVSAVVSAAPGTDLYYLCSIHSWMQGEIQVTGPDGGDGGGNGGGGGQ